MTRVDRRIELMPLAPWSGDVTRLEHLFAGYAWGVKFVLLGFVALAILFVIGFVAPRRSVRVQRWFEKMSRRGERGAERSGGRPGEWTARSLEKFRKGGDRSAEAGRSVHDTLQRATRDAADRVRHNKRH